MAPELFPSVPGAASGLHRKEDKVEDRVTEKVGWMLLSRVSVHGSRQESMARYTCAKQPGCANPRVHRCLLSVAAGGRLLLWCCAVGSLDAG
jgi:hypothetical protein